MFVRFLCSFTDKKHKDLLKEVFGGTYRDLCPDECLNASILNLSVKTHHTPSF